VTAGRDAAVPPPDRDRPPFPRGVVIVGAGLIGTSIGLALRDRGIRVWLADRDPQCSALAATLGAGDLLPTLTTPVTVAPPLWEEADLAVLAVPPDAVAPALAAAQKSGLAHWYTDVASVKAHPVAAVRDLGCDLASYLPGHPLAGRERGGPVAARADLFLGRPWALCPLPETAAAAVAAVTALVLACGAEPVTAEVTEHDRWVALVSHAPHLVASAMAARLAGAPQGALGLVGQGLRDVTRIAAGDPALWTQILTANAAGVADVLTAVADDLRAVADDLTAAAARASQDAHAAPGAGGATPTHGAGGAHSTLTGLLETGAAGVARIPGKHAGPATEYANVQVVIPDRPGELFRLFQACDDARINIEDIRIEHSPGLPVGVAELAVRPDAAASLVTALATRGWVATLVPRVS
jgi:prephenate dehydrogenase